MKRYLARHLQVMFASLGQMLHTPGATAMTVLAIGITLALPVVLYLLVNNVEHATRNWEGRAQLTLYLQSGIADDEAQALVRDLTSRAGIARVEFISADQALSRFKRDSGLSAVVDALESNPLPATVVLYLAPGFDGADATKALAAQLQALPQVELARADTAWIQRLHVILRVVERGVWVLAVLLAVAVVVIISNTIRLHILNRRDEIEIIKLVGGSNAFIRRPFLYTGLYQGLGGAALAVALVFVCLVMIEGPARQLGALYGTSFRLQGLDGGLIMGVLGGGGLLGWLASRWAVQRHLAQIEPR